MVVGMNESFQVGGHYFSRISITPSVSFLVKIPESIEGSFYTAQVFVSLKENVFEASNPVRHATELFHALQETNLVNPVLCLYTDGGPDHRVTLHSVKQALIALFAAGNFDMVVAARTPPQNSWKDPAGRIMSILNLALHGVESRNTYERQLKSCSGLAGIRALSEKILDINVAISESVQPVKMLLG